MSPEILDQVEAALSGTWGTPREIHARLGCWSLISVRHALRELVAAGRVKYRGADCERVYRIAWGELGSSKPSPS